MNFWPFTRLCKGRLSEYDVYLETIRIQMLTWPEAYWCCKDDVKFIDKHARRFETRNKFEGIVRFLILVLATMLIVATAILLCTPELSLSKQILVIAVISCSLVIVEFIIRAIYYRDLESDLAYADNRICVLADVWPDIIDIVCSNTEYDGMPPEPEKVLDINQFRKNIPNTDESQDFGVDAAIFLDDDENENETIDYDSSLDGFFTNSTDGDLQPMEIMQPVPDEIEKPGDASLITAIAELTDEVNTLNDCLLNEGS